MLSSTFAWLGRACAFFAAAVMPVALSAQPVPAQAPPGAAPIATAPVAAPTTAVAPPATAAAGYRIGKGDVIEIGVIGRDDYKARVQVQEDGTIQMPLINSVAVLDQTTLQVRNKISALLQSGGYFVNPALNVTVVSFASRYVTVLGQVATPGVVAIDREYRLSEVIARAGGVSNPSINVITVTKQDGQSQDYLLSAVATGGPGADPMITEGDKIFVAPAKTFYIYGQVNAPGNYPIEPGMTVRMALARAGGLTALGSAKKVKIVRGEKEERAALTQALASGDVLVIGEKFF